jgi:hypothetical protein
LSFLDVTPFNKIQQIYKIYVKTEYEMEENEMPNIVNLNYHPVPGTLNMY